LKRCIGRDGELGQKILMAGLAVRAKVT